MTKKKSAPTSKPAAPKSRSTKKKSEKVVAKPPKAASSAASAKAAKAPAPVKKSPAAKPAEKKAVARKPAAAAKPAAKPKAETKTVKKVAQPAAKPAPKAPVAGAPVRASAPKVQPAQPPRAMAAAGTETPKLTAPAAPKAINSKPVPPAAKATAAPANEPRKPVTARHGFKTNELIVYPAHGVGRIIGIEEQEIAGISLELFVIEFEKDKMTLRVPTAKLESVGMRKLAEDGIVTRALDTLKGRARIKRTMWSRRAQEYEAKINSGDLVAIAEVVRDLYRSEAQPEQSYSERQLYEAALDRMARELAAVDRSDERSAMQRITEILSKSARGRRAAEEAQVAAADAGDGDVKAA